MGNILDSNARARILARIGRVRAEDVPKWGSLSSQRMLFHCAEVNLSILRANGKPPGKASLKQKIMAFFDHHLRQFSV